MNTPVLTKQELEALLHEIRDLPVDDFAVAGRVASITAQISEEFDRLRAAAEPRAPLTPAEVGLAVCSICASICEKKGIPEACQKTPCPWLPENRQSEPPARRCLAMPDEFGTLTCSLPEGHYGHHVWVTPENRSPAHE